MFGMNNEQIMALIRQMLPVLGGIAVSFGWLTTGQVEGFTATVLQLVGPVLIVISTIWALVRNTKASIVATAATVPEVKNIVLHQTQAAVELGQVTPPNVRIEP